LYSAQALLDGLYTVDDLPNSILLVGNPAAKTDPVPELFGTVGWMTGLNLGDSALVYSSFDPSWILFQRFEGDDGLYWDFANNFFAEKCLFAFDDGTPATGLIEDEFADTYTVAWNISNQSKKITRLKLLNRFPRIRKYLYIPKANLQISVGVLMCHRLEN
jgi:hypothetical protein